MAGEFQGRIGTIDSANWLIGSVLDTLNKWEGALALIGLVCTAKFVAVYGWEFLKACRVYFFEPLIAGKKDWVRNYGRWAVVTGATDGVGKEYAKQLASRGMNIVLISRSMEKLVAVSREISTDYGVQTKILQVDFSTDFSIYPRIAKELENIEVGLLVNNVGVFPPYPMYLTEMDPMNLWQHVSVNTGAVTMMTRVVLPQMVERKKGGIINISSGASIGPSALMSAYSASKIYVNYFTEAVRREYSKKGITVQTLTPFYIATNMTAYNDRIGKPSFFVPDARQYVRSSLETFGTLEQGTGYIAHAIQMLGMTILPPTLMQLMKHLNVSGLRHTRSKSN